MWVIVVVAGLLLIAAIVNRLSARDRTPLLERHERALAALAELANGPRPSVPTTPEAELPSGHIRILAAAPAAAPRKRPTRRPAAAKRRSATTSAKARHPSGARRPQAVDPARQTIHIGFDDPTDEPTAPDGIAVDAIVLPVPAAAEAAPAPEVPTQTTPVTQLAPVTRVTKPFTFAPTSRHQHLHPHAARTAVVAAVVVGGSALGMALAAGGNNNTKGAGRMPHDVASVTAPATSTLAPTTTTPVQLARVETLPTGDANVSVTGPFTLAMHATGMCWVEVSGANGQTLFMGTLYPGQNEQISGAAPLVVRLGNTSGMTLAVNGAALDLNGIAKTANVRFLS